ncbi:hypothetical protein EWM64_g10335 [Hericium alpestre]|uniref:Thioredoxin n=1 Tax=Hericium alpestre TaxID=135208 RepID=A0A4Y9ZFZ2_9AGAM|nr:hypothetical protein EWM64_g10335 [Hericium alpestre]
MSPTPITSLAQFKEIISKDRVSIFDFWATWCGPCRVISPVFEQLAAKYPNADYYKVDVDEQPDVSQECGIRAMPTFLAFKNGQKIGEVVGAVPPQLENLIATNAA